MRRALPLLAASALLLAPGAAQAKDLSKRLGLGVDTSFGDVPALSMRYGIPTSNEQINLQVELDAGFSAVEAEPTQVLAGGRLLYGIVLEDNMNVMAGFGGAFVANGPLSTVRLQPVIAMDFFLFGLENLGLTAGTALNIDVGNAGAGIATSGGLLGGVHYWF